ncbi:UDP-galactose transporter [Pelomyxa schiedti]|nr:UDP-galactose transporter [Pelomyxa schiedti]
MLVSYSRGVQHEHYSKIVAVLFIEMTKFVMSSLLMLATRPPSIPIPKYFYDTIAKSAPTSVPAFLYFIQNILAFAGLSTVDGAVFGVLNQLKILTTAVLSVIILKKLVNTAMWRALVELIIAAILVQQASISIVCEVPPMSDMADTSNVAGTGVTTAYIIGIICSLLVTVLSGMASVYFEKVLKSGTATIWERNLQLSMYSIALCSVSVLFDAIWSGKGFAVFSGHSYLTALIVLSSAVGGLLVAMVMKYADNIIKGFAVAVSVLITAVMSWWLLGTNVNMQFLCGVVLVGLSIFNYNKGDAEAKQQQAAAAAHRPSQP